MGLRVQGWGFGYGFGLVIVCRHVVEKGDRGVRNIEDKVTKHKTKGKGERQGERQRKLKDKTKRPRQETKAP